MRYQSPSIKLVLGGPGNMEESVHCSTVYGAGELEVKWVAITEKVNRCNGLYIT